MRRPCYGLLLAVVLSGTAAYGVHSHPAPRVVPAADYFPLHEGDLWRYRSTATTGTTSDFVVTVVRQEKAKNGTRPFVVQTLANGQRVLDWYLKQNGWVIQQAQFPMGATGPTEFRPPKRALKNPPRVKDKWSWKGTGAGGVPVEMHAEVLGAEDVVVPAGKFHALRILTRTIQNGGTVTRTQWYAAGVGMVRAEIDVEEHRTATELVEHQSK